MLSAVFFDMVNEFEIIHSLAKNLSTYFCWIKGI